MTDSYRPRKTRLYQEFSSPHAGVALVYRDKVLVVGQNAANEKLVRFRKPGKTLNTREYSKIGYPKGGPIEGETPQMTAVRELKEETGIEISVENLGLTYIYVRRNRTEACIFYVVFLHPAHECPEVKPSGDAQSEIALCRWVKFDEFKYWSNLNRPTKCLNKELDNCYYGGRRIFDCWKSSDSIVDPSGEPEQILWNMKH